MKQTIRIFNFLLPCPERSRGAASCTSALLSVLRRNVLSLSKNFLLPSSCLLFLLISIVCSLWPNFCLAQDEDPSLSYYEVIEQRNFFRPKNELVADEKKDATEQKQAAYKQTPLKITDLVVTGAVKIRGNYKAILQKKSSEESFYIKANDIVQGYTVKHIQDDKIIFQKDEEEFILNIEKTDSSQKNKTQDETQDQTEQDEETASPEPMKYEPNMMQKLRMGTGGK